MADAKKETKMFVVSGHIKIEGMGIMPPGTYPLTREQAKSIPASMLKLAESKAPAEDKK